MEPITLGEVAAAVGAAPPECPEVLIRGVCTDTRLGCSGSLFFALRGEHADGHDYVPQAAVAGAVAAVVEREVREADIPQLVVPDALRALGDLGRTYAAKLDVRRVAVTGSVGKTSVRSMVAAALSARYSVHQSERNHNNEIGLPLTLLGLHRAHEVVVVEMAMRGRGQIAYLTEIARPEVGLITNIGISHVELLGSREAIAMAKAELLEALPADGTAVLPADDEFFPLLQSIAHRSGDRRIVTFGMSPHADFRCSSTTLTSSGYTEFRVNGITFVINGPGVHHGVNAAAACAVASVLGVSLEEVADRLRTWLLPEMRMTVRRTSDNILLLDDSYNAAPDSLRAALETLAQIAKQTGRRAVAVLGDMKELGEHASEEHDRIGRLPAMASVSVLVTAGDLAARIGAGAETGAVVRCGTSEEAAREVLARVLSGDVVLVKGSRAMAMEKVVAALMANEGREHLRREKGHA